MRNSDITYVCISEAEIFWDVGSRCHLTGICEINVGMRSNHQDSCRSTCCPPSAPWSVYNQLLLISFGRLCNHTKLHLLKKSPFWGHRGLVMHPDFRVLQVVWYFSQGLYSSVKFTDYPIILSTKGSAVL